MTNDEFKELWDLLDALSQKRCQIPLTGLHHGGKINFARKVKSDLDAFCRELAARAKAEYENAKGNYEALADDYGEGFDDVPAEHKYGLDFGKKR